MAQIMGLVDTGDISSDRFYNWRRIVLRLFPNGTAPLQAFMSLMDSEITDDPHINWYEKGMPVQRDMIATIASDVAFNVTTIVMTTSNVFRAGHLLKNETTEEIIKVTAVSTTSLTVVRSVTATWGDPTIAMEAGQYLQVIGNVAGEGDTSGSGIYVDPTAKTNYTQIFRTPYSMSGTALKTTVKYAPGSAWPEVQKDALIRHSTEMELAYIHGVKAEYAGSNGLERTCDGLVQFIPAANKLTCPDGVITRDWWETQMELLFRYCLNKNNEKLALAGSNALCQLNKMAQDSGFIEIVPESTAFGMQIQKWITPYGTLFLKMHPLFSQHPTWRNECLIVDLPGLKHRPMRGRDTQRLQNRQANDADQRKEEFLTESCPEVNHGSAHMYLKNIVSFNKA